MSTNPCFELLKKLRDDAQKGYVTPGVLPELYKFLKVDTITERLSEEFTALLISVGSKVAEMEMPQDYKDEVSPDVELESRLAYNNKGDHYKIFTRDGKAGNRYIPSEGNEEFVDMTPVSFAVYGNGYCIAGGLVGMLEKTRSFRGGNREYMKDMSRISAFVLKTVIHYLSHYSWKNLRYFADKVAAAFLVALTFHSWVPPELSAKSDIKQGQSAFECSGDRGIALMRAMGLDSPDRKRGIARFFGTIAEGTEKGLSKEQMVENFGTKYGENPKRNKVLHVLFDNTPAKQRPRTFGEELLDVASTDLLVPIVLFLMQFKGYNCDSVLQTIAPVSDETLLHISELILMIGHGCPMEQVALHAAEMPKDPVFERFVLRENFVTSCIVSQAKPCKARTIGMFLDLILFIVSPTKNNWGPEQKAGRHVLFCEIPRVNGGCFAALSHMYSKISRAGIHENVYDLLSL